MRDEGAGRHIRYVKGLSFSFLVGFGMDARTHTIPPGAGDPARHTAAVGHVRGEFGVAAIPVSVFNPDGKDDRVIRFCFAKQEATLAEACERLARFC